MTGGSGCPASGGARLNTVSALPNRAVCAARHRGSFERCRPRHSSPGVDQSARGPNRSPQYPATPCQTRPRVLQVRYGLSSRTACDHESNAFSSHALRCGNGTPRSLLRISSLNSSSLTAKGPVQRLHARYSPANNRCARSDRTGPIRAAGSILRSSRRRAPSLPNRAPDRAIRSGPTNSRP